MEISKPTIRVAEIVVPPGANVFLRPVRHPDAGRLAELMSHAHDMQALADKYGISDIFQDNGGKLLQVLIRLGAVNIPGRMGNDIVWLGSETELKTLNMRLGAGHGFTTAHHLDAGILAKYRSVPWVFCTCEGIEVSEAWWVHPIDMEPVFADWEAKLAVKVPDAKGRIHLNNPKVPQKLVRRVGHPIDMSASAPHR